MRLVHSPLGFISPSPTRDQALSESRFFYHCVGRCWWVVIVFLYFLDVLVWVALLLAKVHGTEVKKKEKYIVPSTLTDPLVKLFFIKTSARKLLQNNVFTTRPQQPLYATLSKHQFIHTTTKTLDAIATTKTINLKKRYSKIYQSSQQENRYI